MVGRDPSGPFRATRGSYIPRSRDLRPGTVQSMRGVRGNTMRDAEARLIHDLRNAATVLRAAAAQLQEHDDDAPAGVAEQLVEIIGRRSEMVLGLLDEL